MNINEIKRIAKDAKECFCILGSMGREKKEVIDYGISPMETF